MRSKKQGSALELQVMAALDRKVREVPSESRKRVQAWFASQSFEDEPAKAEVDPRQATLGLS